MIFPMQTKERTIVIPHTKIQEVRYAVPASLRAAAGLLKGRGVDPLRYQQQIRKGWARRLKRLIPKRSV